MDGDTISVYQRTLEDVVYYLDNHNVLTTAIFVTLIFIFFGVLGIGFTVNRLRADLILTEIQKSKDRHDYINRLTSILARDELELMRLANKVDNGNGGWKG